MTEFKGLADAFGISWEFLVAGLPAVILFTEFCKKVFKLTGYWNLIPAAVVGLVVSAKSAPDFGSAILGAVILVIFGSGLWQAGKGLAKKTGAVNSK